MSPPLMAPSSQRRRPDSYEREIHAVAVGLAHHHHRHPALAAPARRGAAASGPALRRWGSCPRRRPRPPARAPGAAAPAAEPGPAREHLEQEDARVQLARAAERLPAARRPGSKRGVDAQRAQHREVGALEGVVLGHLHLAGAVAAVEVRVEADGHLARARGAPTVTASMRLSRASVRISPSGRCEPVSTTGLVEPAQHEGQRAGRVGERVGAVGHHRAVEAAAAAGGGARPAASTARAASRELSRLREQLELDVGQLRRARGRVP